jgi:phosphoglycerate dehydrogenase-like enzyme
MNAVFILGDANFEKVYGPEEQRDIAARVTVLAPPYNAKTILEHPEVLRQADLVFSSWGMALLDETFLAAAPRLKAVFYAAGSVKGFVTDARSCCAAPGEPMPCPWPNSPWRRSCSA